MKAAILQSPGQLEVKEVETPLCPPGGILVKVHTSAICGADAKMVRHGHRALHYPRIPGHEVVGTIVESRAASSVFQGGEPVQIAPGISCGNCYYCRRGASNLCPDVDIMGFSRDGGFAEYLALPASGLNSLHLIPEGLAFSEAVLAEPLACCINGQQLAGVKKGETVLILGAGPIGCLHAMLAREFGAARVLLADKLKSRIGVVSPGADRLIHLGEETLAEVVHQETQGRGVDVILLACAGVEAIHSLLALLAPRGRISFFSGFPTNNSIHSLDTNAIHYRELALVGAYGCTSEQNWQALQLLSSGKIKAGWLVTRTIPLEQIVAGIEDVAQCRGLKTLVNPC